MNLIARLDQAKSIFREEHMGSHHELDDVTRLVLCATANNSIYRCVHLIVPYIVIVLAPSSIMRFHVRYPS